MPESKISLESYDNSWYKPGRNILVRTLWYFVNALILDSYLFPSSAFKRFTLRIFGARIGEGVIIKPKVSIKYPWRLKIGNNSWIGEKAWLDNLDDITIGDNVCISQGALLLTGNHNYKKRGFDLITKPILLEDGVWIGARSIVCPGVTGTSHSILQAGSVISTMMEAYTIYQGNPALPIKKRDIPGV